MGDTISRYNPVLGEFFRCTYTYEDGSEGFFISEQVSHHPVSLKLLVFSDHMRLHRQGHS